MNEEELIYHNGTGTEVSGRIRIDFFSQLFENFSSKFEKIIDIINSNHGSNFNERQSYGIFIKSIPDEPSSKDFVLTEVSLLREGQSSKGRVDFFIFYRNWLFLIELKLARTTLSINENSEYKKLSDKWDDVIEQVDDIPVGENKILDEFMERLKANGIIKIPMMIVIYHENQREKDDFLDIDKANECVNDKFCHLYNIIEPEYSYFKFVNNKHPLRLKDNRYRLIRGISFFANADVN